jgi:predicted aspartyl protease
MGVRGASALVSIRMRRPARLPFCVAAVSALAACSGSSASGGPDAALPYTGTLGEPIVVQDVTDILIVPVTVNGVTAAAIVDTGSPIVALDPASFPHAALPDGSGPVDMLTVGDLHFPGATVIGANLITSPDPSIPFGGSLGCAVLCEFEVSLNYRDSRLTLGPGAPPANIETPGVSVPFVLGGGGIVSLTGVPGQVTFPPSRIMLTATIEGTEYPFIVDTGSSLMTLRESLFSGLVKDGRAVISGIDTATVGMQSMSSVARLRSVVIGGALVEGLVGGDDPNLEQTLDDIAMETGSPVSGLVGGSFLRQFFVVVDYPGAALRLQRYSKGGPTFDTFDRVAIGVAVADGDSPATVSGVFAGSAPAKLGVAIGDEVVAIDGEALGKLGSTAINQLLSGPLGSTKTVTFAMAASASLAHKTVTIAVEDILPL